MLRPSCTRSWIWRAWTTSVLRPVSSWAVDADGLVRAPLSGGTERGRAHGFWKAHRFSDMVGRCLDLKAAYKQLARAPADCWASVLAVCEPSSGEVKLFEAVALPFGAVASVMAFNRAASALRMILSRLFHLQVTNFFDDFCQFEHELLSKSAWDTTEAVLTLVGWDISMGEDKRKPFAKLFEILGAPST